MTDHSILSVPAGTPLPPDDPSRPLVVAAPADVAVPHLAIAGGVYSILVPGSATEGRYSLVDMLVPDGAGPPPHRHDFEEAFTILEGEVEFTFRGETITGRAGQTVAIPANAPHAFRNRSGRPARLLCLCSPAGQDAFFLEVGERLPSRDATPPKPTPEQAAARGERAKAAASRYRTEMLPP